MNASKQKWWIHRHRMHSNIMHRKILDAIEREKLIRKDLERVLKSEKHSGPDTQRSG